MLMNKLNQNRTERELHGSSILLPASGKADRTLPAKIAEFQDVSLRVEKEDLRFDIPVTHPVSMDVHQRVE